MIKIYGYKKCSTCNKAIKYFKEKNIKSTFIDVTLEKISKNELSTLMNKSGLETKKFFNTSGQLYRQMKDELGEMTQSQIVTTLSQNGMLIKRPIITDGKKVTLGWRVETQEQW